MSLLSVNHTFGNMLQQIITWNCFFLKVASRADPINAMCDFQYGIIHIGTRTIVKSRTMNVEYNQKRYISGFGQESVDTQSNRKLHKHEGRNHQNCCCHCCRILTTTKRTESLITALVLRFTICLLLWKARQESLLKN